VSEPTVRQVQALQEQLPPHLARQDLAELAVLLRYAEHGAWAFAIYNTVPMRDEVTAALREFLCPLPTYECALTADQPSSLNALQRLNIPEPRAVVFFYDLDQAGDAAWQHLELEREHLASLPYGLVFWIDPSGWRAAVRRAPNFWSQRSGVFDFRIESPQMVAEVRAAWAGQPVRLSGPDDWERQMRLFAGLLREYEAADAPPAAQASLHAKLAYLSSFADRHAEAIEHLQRQLDLARQAGDRRAESEALNNLGREVEFERGRMAAIEWYERALEAAGEDPAARAQSLRNLGAALATIGEAERAQELLDQALSLFRAVGDRLGEADTLRAIGDVHNFRKQIDDALAAYEQALSLFRAVGSRLGEANTLQAIGHVHNFRDKYDDALAAYDQALSLFRAVGSRLGEANTLQAIGHVLRFRDKYDDALAAYDQALSLFRAVGDRLGEANTLQAIGDLYLEQDRVEQAFGLYDQAMQLYLDIGARVGQANVNWTQGRWLAEHERGAQAIPHLEAAVRFVHEIDHPVAARTE